jgi:hypothetical protein
MLINAAAEYPIPDEDEASKEALQHKPECNLNTLPCAPLPQKAVLFCPLPGQVHHLSGGSQSCLGIIWIFLTCMRKWATMSAQK